MHRLRLMSFDKMRLISVAAKQVYQLVLRKPRKDSWVCYFVAIQMQDRQHSSVPGWIEELVRVPTGGQWPRLGLALSNNTAGQQVRIVEYRSECVYERIAQFSA